ncbi:zinc finger AN1 domain-containing stress-associated protein 12 [Tanacetum coccineum]
MATLRPVWGCDSCEKVFCVEHRSYKFHECSNSDHTSRKVLLCETCSMSMEIPRNNKGGKEEMALILAKHEKYGDCDPKKKKSTGVRRSMAAAVRVGGGARPFLVSLASKIGQDYGKKNNGSKIVERRTML